MLYEKALLLAGIEASFRVEEALVPGTDAILVGDPQFNPDITQLQRNNVRSNLSPLPITPGRKIGQITFTHEVRGNGNLDGTVVPQIGRLFRGCGMSETQVTGATGTLGNAVPDAGNTGTITWAKTTAYTGYIERTVTVTCTTGGGSGVAVVDITALEIGEVPAFSAIGVTVTDATPIAFPDSAEYSPTVGVALVSGDTWTMVLTPSGYEYQPVSDSFESLTMFLYYDGILHKMTGGRGTWSMAAEGGQYGLYTFNYTGDYVAVTDAAFPGGIVYETQKPSQVELAHMYIDGVTDFCASRFAIDLANNVVVKACVDEADAFAGALITNRAPTFAFDPETRLEATHPFWANLAAGQEMAITAKVGVAKGNVNRFVMPNAQYSNIGYDNRDGLRVYDITANLAGSAGNDEIKVAIN